MKGGARIEEEKKAGDERVFNRLDPNYIGNSWWQHNRADALRIHTYEEVDVSWLQTIASNAFDGSQRLKNFNIFNCKVVDDESGDDITGATLDTFIRKAIHEGENKHKNVCKTFEVNASLIES